MNFIDRIPPDKAHHCILGVIVALSASLLAQVDPTSAAYANEVGLVAGAIVGAMKEAADWWDNRKLRSMHMNPRHGVEFYDFLATSLGASVPLCGQLLS